MGSTTTISASLVPRPTPFFFSLVSVDNNTRMRNGSPPFHICVLLSTETEEQKKRGRPGNEATSRQYDVVNQCGLHYMYIRLCKLCRVVKLHALV